MTGKLRPLTKVRSGRYVTGCGRYLLRECRQDTAWLFKTAAPASMYAWAVEGVTYDARLHVSRSGLQHERFDTRRDALLALAAVDALERGGAL